MTNDYLIIEENVVTNEISWDGNVNDWTPPLGATVLLKSTTPSLIWQLNADKTDFVLIDCVGYVNIGFTWDGTVCTTNEPKPEIPVA